MTEKVITFVNTITKRIIGFIIVKETEEDFIKGELVTYLPPFLQTRLFGIFNALKGTTINIPTLTEKINSELISHCKTHFITLLEPFELVSNNKNKSSRNQRILNKMRLDKSLERKDFVV